MVEAATRALGLQTAMKELGVEVSVELATDSSAAKSFASRRGLGRMRHIQVKQLWLQTAVAAGRLTLKKVNGKTNPADLLTKYLSQIEIEGHAGRMSLQLE